MDTTTREQINHFLAHYDTLAIATEQGGQPFVTRAFFVEKPLGEQDTAPVLYATFIVTSRKLANLRENPRVGLFIGPDQPSIWMEATATARVLEGEQASAEIREMLGKKSAVAAGFLARVPVAAVEFRVNWLRITDLTGGPVYTEATFGAPSPAGETKA
jgi:nitroimidazol reductase NimA-like FMN-containing flavoprotein (pyridoxamine 5'-phosphate oxidase superfamily)